MREPAHTDEKTENSGKENTQHGHKQGVEQADIKSTAITLCLIERYQRLNNTETRFLREEIETCSDTPHLKIVQSILEQVIANEDDTCNQQELKKRRPEYRSPPECGLGRSSLGLLFNRHKIPPYGQELTTSLRAACRPEAHLYG